MKAIIQTKFGGPEVLKLQELDKPSPGKNEILIKIHAASANAYDWRHIRADPWMIHLMGAGLFKVKHPILGADMAGTVEAVGKGVKSFKPGDQVFGEGSYGGFAEYASVDEKKMVLKPEGVSFEDAAASPMAALTALQGLRDNGRITSGQKVLINGASGGVGSFALQIAKTFNTEITGVCSTNKMDFVNSLGADHVIDYTKDDICKMGEKYDLIYDTAAYHSIKEYKRIMKPDARYVLAGGSISRIFKLMLKSSFGNKNMSAVMAKVVQSDLQLIGEMLESGKIKSRIDKVYPLEETAIAIKELEEGRVKGKVVISVA